MRLFLALEIPPNRQQAIGRMADRLLYENPVVRRVPVGNYHVTLYFAGACDAGQRDRLLHTVQTVCKKAGDLDLLPLTLSLGRIGTFRNRSGRSGPPTHTLWVGVKPDPDLQSVYRMLLDELKRTGFSESSGRRFHPHITLARQVPAHGFRDDTEASTPITWTSTGPALFESRFQSGGVTYRVLRK